MIEALWPLLRLVALVAGFKLLFWLFQRAALYYNGARR
jgi:nitrate reductase NapE component